MGPQHGLGTEQASGASHFVEAGRRSLSQLGGRKNVERFSRHKKHVSKNKGHETTGSMMVTIIYDY